MFGTTRYGSGRQHALLAAFALIFSVFQLTLSSEAQQLRRSVDASDLFAPAEGLSFAKAMQIASPAVIAVSVRPRACEMLREGGDFILRDFPIPDGSLADLELKEFKLFTPESRFYSRIGGKDVPRPMPSISFYRGSILGVSSSFVYLSVAESEISGSISRNGVDYSFTTMLNDMPQEGDRVLSIYESTDEMKFYECLVDDHDFIDDYGRSFPAPTVLQRDQLDTLVATLAVEADYEAFLHFGSSTMTENYITMIVGNSAAIYERDVAVSLHIGYLRIWEEEDPYEASSANAALNAFTGYWRENMGHVERTLAALISRKPISAPGVSQGVAWVNQLCSKTHGYSYTKLSRNNNWIDGHVGVFAHELGHNFGSPHTHSCLWNPPIDSCYTAEPIRNQPPCFSEKDIHLILGGGEMMSYCHMRFGRGAKHNIFRDRVGALVRHNSERALCMNVISSIRALVLLEPAGGGQYCGGAELTITWDAQGNNDFSILLSSDGGVTYPTTLATDIARYERSWTWIIPNDFPPGDLYRLKIIDNKLPELTDEMRENFEILKGTHITEQVYWRNVCVGEGAWFWVRAAGVGELSYQWKKNGEILPNETRNELQLQDLQLSDNLSEFTCVVTGDCGAVESEAAVLKVFNGAVFLKNLQNDTTCIGGTARFEVVAEGSNLSYKWYFRSPQGVNRTIDRDTNVLIIQNVEQSDFGSYWCVVNSTCGAATSQTRFLVIPQNSVEVLTPQVWGQAIPAGGQYRIGWKQFCLNSVKIEYSIDGGAQWSSITGSYDANAGEYLWNVPATEAEDCYFRISDSDNPETSGLSKQFKIRNMPGFALERTEISFSWVAVGEAPERVVSIMNPGRAPLEVSGTTISGTTEVTVSNGAPFTLAPGGTHELLLTYEPRTPTSMTGMLRIDHNAAGSPDTIMINGEAFIATTVGRPAQSSALTLLGHYPNPVALSTGGRATLLVQLPRAEVLSITLYSVLGKQSRLLHDSWYDAGRHALTVSFGDIAAGMYILRIATPNGSASGILHIVP